uniref:Uncharacterized protein n=1 Tax=Acrobeloides nanus TaxID=290746 RepID=A0A914E5M6_9BILA
MGQDQLGFDYVDKSWDRFMSKNVRKLPILLVPYVKLIQEENCFETQKFEAVEKHQIGSKNKESKFKLKTLPNAQNYTIEHFKIVNDSFESNPKKDKLKKNIAANQKQTLNLLSNHQIKIWNLQAEFEHDQELGVLLNHDFDQYIDDYIGVR